MSASELDDQPVDTLTDTGKIYLVVRKAIKDANEEERKYFDPIRFVRNICNIAVKELDKILK